VLGVIENLLADKLTRSSVERRREITSLLTAELLLKIVFKSWLPTPVDSLELLQQQLTNYLRLHRVDWREIFGGIDRRRDHQSLDDGRKSDDFEDDDEDHA
jgi:hypothetical protein